MLRIAAELLSAIKNHAEAAYPEECCGILLGRVAEDAKLAVAQIRTRNVAEEPRTRYRIAPEEIVRAQRQAREEGCEIIGFYHSHPDHAAAWSPTDLAEAHWLGCSYLITAVEKGRAAETNSFLLSGASEEEKHLAEEPIEILSI